MNYLHNKITEKLKQNPDFKAKILIDFKDGRFFSVDSTVRPAVFSADYVADYDLKLTCTQDVFENLLNGTQDPNLAFMMGKLKVDGSMGLALKLNALLE
jgi:putative sterol carrier protein